MSQVRRAGFVLLTVVAAALVLSFTWRPAPPPRFHALSPSAIPMQFYGFQGTDIPLQQDVLQALESAQVINRQYVAVNGGFTVAFALVGGADRTALHDPRSCLVGAGGQIDNDHVEMLPKAGIAVRTCNAIFGTGDDGVDWDTVYFYVTKDGIVSSATDIRMKLLLNSLVFQKGDPIFFLKFTTPVPTDDSPADKAVAHRKLESFAAAMWRNIKPALAKETGFHEV